MSGKLGKIKGVSEDSNGIRQFIINCLGNNDQTKYFSITPFGTDFNAPIDTKALTVGSQNRDESFAIGTLSKLKVDDLDVGETAIFSTSSDGSEIKSFIKFRNDGTMEQNGDSDFIAGFNGLESAINALNTFLNTELPLIAAGIATGGGSYTPGTANIDVSDSKKENLKTE